VEQSTEHHRDDETTHKKRSDERERAKEIGLQHSKIRDEIHNTEDDTHT